MIMKIKLGISESTKSMAMDMPLFPLLFFFLGLEQASENTGGVMKKICCKFTLYSVGQVHNPFFFTPVKCLSILLEHSNSLYSVAIFWTVGQVTSEEPATEEYFVL